MCYFEFIFIVNNGYTSAYICRRYYNSLYLTDDDYEYRMRIENGAIRYAKISVKSIKIAFPKSGYSSNGRTLVLGTIGCKFKSYYPE